MVKFVVITLGTTGLCLSLYAHQFELSIIIVGATVLLSGLSHLMDKAIDDDVNSTK